MWIGCLFPLGESRDSHFHFKKPFEKHSVDKCARQSTKTYYVHSRNPSNMKVKNEKVTKEGNKDKESGRLTDLARQRKLKPKCQRGGSGKKQANSSCGAAEKFRNWRQQYVMGWRPRVKLLTGELGSLSEISYHLGLLHYFAETRDHYPYPSRLFPLGKSKTAFLLLRILLKNTPRGTIARLNTCAYSVPSRNPSKLKEAGSSFSRGTNH